MRAEKIRVGPPKLIAPGVQSRTWFGSKRNVDMPVVAGTWYLTAAIAASYAKGRTLKQLAKAYGISVRRIENALRYELSRAAR